MSHNVCHTVKRGEIYHFNIRIPRTNSIYRRSLRTDSPSLARTLSSRIKNHIDDMQLVVGGKVMKSDIDSFIEMLISNKVNQVVRVAKALTEPLSQTAKGQYSEYYHRTDSIRSEQYNFDRMDWGYMGIKQPVRPTMLSYNDWVSNNLKNTANYDYMNTHFFKDDGDVNEEAPFYDDFEFPTVHTERYNHLNDIVTNHTNNLASAALANQSLRFRAELKELETKFSPLLPNPIPTMATPITSEAPLFKDLIPDYLEYIKGVDSKKYDTKKLKQKFTEHKKHMEMWSIPFGELRIDEIKLATISDAWGVFSLLPVTNNKKGLHNPYAGLSVQERWVTATDNDIEIGKDLCYSWENARKYRTELSKFLNWCVREEYTTNNPIGNDAGLNELYNFKERRIPRTKFSDLIASKIVTYCKNNLQEVKNWGVLIMAYHGMRNSEVLSLTKANVITDEDTSVVYLNITDGKSENALRKVPVHKELLKQGFMAFVDNCIDRLFDVPANALTGHYSNVLKPELDLPDMSQYGKRLSLYSFRHCVISALAMNDTHQAKQNALVGHTNVGSQDPYIHFDPIILKPIIDQIKY